MTEILLRRLESKVGGRLHLLSGVTRRATERQEFFVLSTQNVEGLLAAVPQRDAVDLVDDTLMWLSSRQGAADTWVEYSDDDYPLVFARNMGELDWAVRRLSMADLIESASSSGAGGVKYQLTPEGWQRVRTLRTVSRNSKIGFVAMWFDTQMDTAWSDGFAPALKATGFDSIRSNAPPHNDNIVFRIIADIRRSGLVVADFTGQRGGVYFEAGFAMGLGIPVIRTCRRDYWDSLHFDVKQYTTLDWESPAELKEKLTDQIHATVVASR